MNKEDNNEKQAQERIQKGKEIASKERLFQPQESARRMQV